MIINSGKSNLSNRIIDIYSKNVTLEWQNISLIHTCGNQKMINVPLFTCKLSVGYLKIRDISFLGKKILYFNESTCPLTTTQVTELNPSKFQCPDPNYIGPDCNIPNNPCDMAKLCDNDGICHYNNTLPLKYHCQCPTGVEGDNCGDDKRICKNNTCW